MKPIRILSDDDAVSPVIGVILMVAVTVIMAAIVGAFVLSISGDVSVVPQTQWDTDTSTDASGNVNQIEFRQRAGDRVQTDQLSVQIPADRASVDGNETGGQTQVGDRIVIELDDSGAGSSGLGPQGDDVLLVWTADDGTEDAVLAEHTFTRSYWEPVDAAYTE